MPYDARKPFLRRSHLHYGLARPPNSHFMYRKCLPGHAADTTAWLQSLLRTNATSSETSPALLAEYPQATQAIQATRSVILHMDSHRLFNVLDCISAMQPYSNCPQLTESPTARLLTARCPLFSTATQGPIGPPSPATITCSDPEDPF